MANEQNLIPLNERTKSEQRKIQTAGGIASGETRRNKKLLKDCIEILLETEIDDGKGGKKTGAEALTVKLFKEAMKGNVKAFEVLRDTAGQKPIEKVMISDVEQSVIDEVERMVENEKGTSG